MTTTPSLPQRLFKGDLAIPFYVGLLRLLLHLSVNLFGGYGIFRDELYYLACAEHLSTGYVDHPPFSVYVLHLTVSAFGDSLFVIRLVPAMAAGATVFLTGLITQRIGGNNFATFLACVCSFSLISLATSSYYSMNSLDMLCWTGVAYTVTLIIQEQRKHYWILLGVLLGIGLLNKIGVLFLGVGLLASLLLTKERKWLRTPWPYITGLIAFGIFSPYILWNMQHDWAHLEFIREASTEKYSSLSSIAFIKDQFLIHNPVASIVWIAGLFALFFQDSLRPYRPLVYLYVLPCIIFIVNGTSKAEYLAPAYCILWAAGSVGIERVAVSFRFGGIARYALCLVIIAFTLVLTPLVLPVLPVERYISYAHSLGIEPDTAENKELGELPQFYADMFGWQQKAEVVASVYQALPVAEKEKCAIYGSNYGRCGAIDYYGERLGLPKAIGSHNNYWIWGPRDYTGEVMILMGGSYDEYIQLFDEVKLAATIHCQYCMPYEDNMGIYLCKGLKGSLTPMWPTIKHYD